LLTPSAFDILVRESPSEYCRNVWCGKIEWCGCDGKKNLEDKVILFDRIHERDRRTNGQTPRDGIGRAYA